MALLPQPLVISIYTALAYGAALSGARIPSLLPDRVLDNAAPYTSVTYTGPA
jgi:hypothetical protein